jgi:hypothetical protein
MAPIVPGDEIDRPEPPAGHANAAGRWPLAALAGVPRLYSQAFQPLLGRAIGQAATRLRAAVRAVRDIPWRAPTRREILSFGGLPLFWAIVLVLQLLPLYDHGWRALFMVLTVALMTCSLLLGEDRHPLGIMRGETWLVRVAACLVGIQALFCCYELFRPEIGHIAEITLSAARVMLFGGNPYVVPTDPLFVGPQVAEGYKLPPFGPVAYMPLGVLLGPRGLRLTNLIIQLLVVRVILEVARGDSPRHRNDGMLAAIIFLALPIVPLQIFRDGAIDLLAVLLALLGILQADRRSLFAGLAAGLSCSTSLMPGAAVLPLCIPGSTQGRERFLVGLMLGLLPTILYFVRAPSPFLINVLGLGLDNAGNPEGASVGLSEEAALLVQSVAAMMWLALALIAWRRPLELEQRCGLAAIVVLSAILVMPATHSSETLWWLPLAAIAVARPALLELTRLSDAEEAREAASRMSARLSGLARGLAEPDPGAVEMPSQPPGQE